MLFGKLKNYKEENFVKFNNDFGMKSSALRSSSIHDSN